LRQGAPAYTDRLAERAFVHIIVCLKNNYKK
jgi:hypothetical protein